MKEKIKIQKGFIQIPLLVAIISLLTSVGIGMVTPDITKAVQALEAAKAAKSAPPK